MVISQDISKWWTSRMTLWKNSRSCNVNVINGEWNIKCRYSYKILTPYLNVIVLRQPCIFTIRHSCISSSKWSPIDYQMSQSFASAANKINLIEERPLLVIIIYKVFANKRLFMFIEYLYICFDSVYRYHDSLIKGNVILFPPDLLQILTSFLFPLNYIFFFFCWTEDAMPCTALDTIS